MITLSEKKKQEKKKLQLGMPYGTATNRLRKSIMFDLVCRLELNNCFQCNKTIDNEIEFSIEHKVPYLDSDNPVEKYFSLQNIAFSHHSCNVGASRKTRIPKHGTSTMYCSPYNCRCELCKKYRKDRWHNNKN